MFKRLLLGARSKFKTIVPEVHVLDDELQKGSCGVLAFGIKPEWCRVIWEADSEDAAPAEGEGEGAIDTLGSNREPEGGARVDSTRPVDQETSQGMT